MDPSSIELNKNYNEDCRNTMQRMMDNSVDLIITSPPYHVQKEYEKKETYEEYKALMKAVFLYSERVLKPGGYMVVNFGDYFNSGNRFYNADVPACYPASLNYFHWGVEIAGMDLQATRIWRKQFAKMGIPFVCNSHPRNVFDYEHVWTFRKKNGNGKEKMRDVRLSQRGVLGDDPIFRRKWNSKADIKTHCAAFPIELPIWAIQVYSDETDLVYDPFMGIATTAVACIKTHRNWIGSELDKTHYDNGNKRVQMYLDQPSLF